MAEKGSKISVEITGDASGLKKAAKQAEDAVEGIERKSDDAGKKAGGLGGVFNQIGGQASNLAGQHLGPLGDALDTVGADLGKIPGGAMVAGAAIAGIGTFVAQGVGKLNDMTTEVRAFKDEAGTSWEESSRLVAAMDDLGISSESGSKAMSKLARTVNDSPAAFAAAGIEIERTNTGAADMTGTLVNVADRFAAIRDPAERAALGTRLFGKGWADLVPLIEQGGGALNDALAGVKDYQIVTAEAAAQQREYSLAVDDLQDAVAGLQMALAKDLIPELSRSAAEGARFVDFVNEATAFMGGFQNVLKTVNGPATGIRELIGGLGGVFGTAGEAVGDATDGFVGVAAAMAKAGAAAGTAEGTTRLFVGAMDDAAGAALDAAGGQAELNAKIQDGIDKQRELRDALLESFDKQLAAESATRRASEASVELAEKTAAVTEATATYGAGSVEATAATRAYEESLTGSKEAALRSAGAAVELARKQAEVRGETLSAHQENALYMASLEQVRDTTLDPNLQAGMQSLIDQLAQQDAKGRDAEAALRGMEQAARAAGRAAGEAALAMLNAVNTPRPEMTNIAALAHGGAAQAGHPYLVGEQGPELMVPQRSGTVIPAGDTAALLGGGGGGATYHVTVNGMMATDLRSIAQGIREELRRLERAAR